MAKYKRKYVMGDKITTLADCARWLDKGNHIYERGRFVHNGWAMSWQLRHLRNIVNHGMLNYAHSTELKDAPHLGLNHDLEK